MNPPYPVTRKDKKILSGSLTPKFVDPDTAHIAIEELAAISEHCTLVYKPPIYDHRTGKEGAFQEQILERIDLIKLDNETKEELLKSRHISILAKFKDSGILLVDMPGRAWKEISRSHEARKAILEFGRRLESGAKSPLLTLGWAFAYLMYPLTFLTPIIGAEFSIRYIVDPSFRKYYETHEDFPDSILLTDSSLSDLFYLAWPPLIFLAVFIWVVHLLGGGLQAWPRSFSIATLHRAFHHFATKLLPEDFNQIRATVITITITSACTFFLSKLF